jgi:hypothetical protein
MKIREATTGVVLVILTSANSCNMDNLDAAVIEVTPPMPQAECEPIAAAIDARRSIRAICVPEATF